MKQTVNHYNYSIYVVDTPRTTLVYGMGIYAVDTRKHSIYIDL